MPLINLSVPATLEELQAATAQPADSKKSYHFGFELRNGTKEDARQYLPLLDYLAQSTGQRFSLRFTQGTEHLLAELTRGQLHFAAIGAGSYLSATPQGPIIPLAHGIDTAGRELAVSDLYPSNGIFAHATVPTEVRSSVRRALIGFDPQEHPIKPYNWDATEIADGFANVSTADYEPLRTWAKRLGLLAPIIAEHTSP